MKRRDRDLRGSILLLSEKEKEKEIYRPSLMVGQEVEVEVEIEMDVIYDMISNKIFFFFLIIVIIFLPLFCTGAGGCRISVHALSG
jgi:hypothetical protein